MRQSIVRFYWMKVTPLCNPIVNAVMPHGMAESPEFAYYVGHKEPFFDKINPAYICAKWYTIQYIVFHDIWRKY